MKNNDKTIKLNGVIPPLHLKNEPGKYMSFLLNVKNSILNDLNMGGELEVTMEDQNQAEKLLKDLIKIGIDNETEFIIRIENSLLKVCKRFSINNRV